MQEELQFKTKSVNMKLMDISKYRKKIFFNSQYCVYYNAQKCTILAGIMRSLGYKYSVILPDEKLSEIKKVYRKFTAIVNSCVAIEIILYIYLVIFPYFTQFMKMPIILAVLVLSFVPLMLLYVTYLGINFLYENYLTRYVGTFQRTKFKPELRYFKESEYQEYQKTPRKSSYILGLLVAIFCFYAFVPAVIGSCNYNKNYNLALYLSNVYLTFVPISPEVYADRAYAKFMLKRYPEAKKDYVNANKYSMSDNFSIDILGTETYFLNPDEMLKAFDNAIKIEKEEPVKYLLLYEKATYLLKNKEYNSALKIYNSILSAYKQRKGVFFSPAKAYYNRAQARKALGDYSGAKLDETIAKRMCPDCKFNTDTTLIKIPF